MVSTKAVGSAVLVLALAALGFGGGCSSEGVVNPGDGAQGGSSSGGASSGGAPTGGTSGTGFSGAGFGGTPTGGTTGIGGTASGGTPSGGTAGVGGTPSGGVGGVGGTSGSAPGGASGSAGASGAAGASGTGPGCATSGQVMCGGACVDPMTDANHCGACGTVCSGGRTCMSGTCGCPNGGTVCNNACVNTQTNPMNCGACGTACPSGQVCSMGRCASNCGSGTTSCNNGCVNTMTDANNCGACGTVCSGGRSCTGGTCACPGGQTFCNNACVNTMTSATNCGACGTACNNGRSCSAGMCVCPQGQTYCNNACVNTMTSTTNCGACGRACTTGQTCSNGTCMGGTTTSGVIGWASVSGNGVTTTTGGSGGTTVDVSTASALQSAASSSTRQTIRLTASVSVSALDVASNKTIVGVGNNITISGGIEINNVNNVIIQNIKLNARTTGANGDGIRITGSHHVWIDHMEVWDAPDGNMDISEASNYITISWTKFWYSASPPNNDHRYSNLIGSGDGETGDENALNITWHHNWWAERVHERMPRVRFGDVHVFNNYYSSSGNNYCIRAGYHSNVLIENNHFQGVDTPHEMGEDQGTAIVTARGNQYTNTTGGQGTRGTAFTPPYQYTLDPASSVAAAVMSGAGPR